MRGPQRRGTVRTTGGGGMGFFNAWSHASQNMLPSFEGTALHRAQVSGVNGRSPKG